jgi:small-conductance mechanosensitive channel
MLTRLMSLVLALTAPLAVGLPAGFAQSSAVATPDPAPLVFHNREIVLFRAVLTGYTPEERAEAAQERLQRALEKGVGHAVTVRPVEDTRLIEVGGVGIFFLAPGDLDPLSGESLDAATARVVDRLTTVLAETREARDLRAILRAFAAVGVATLLLAVLGWALMRATRWLARRADVASRSIAERVKIGDYSPLSARTVGRLARTTVNAAGLAMGLFLIYGWLTFSLERFPYTRPWAEGLISFLLSVLGTVARGVAHSIPGLVFVVVIVLITRAIVRSLGAFLHRVEAGKVTVGWLDADTAAPTRRILTVLLWLFALAMAYPYLPGSDSEAFKGLSVLVGLMLSIGASGIVGQAAGGLIITYSRTLRMGEYVRIGDTEGTVSELGIFNTRIRTGLGEEVSLPNAYVVANTTRNYSRVVTSGRGFVLDTQVTIGYATPWRQVHAMLLEAARRTAGMLEEPKPFVVQTALSDFYVEYRLVCYAGPEAPQRRAMVLDALHANIQDVFNEHGVQIMSPHYMMDPAQPQVVPKEKWHEPPAAPPGGDPSGHQNT